MLKSPGHNDDYNSVSYNSLHGLVLQANLTNSKLISRKKKRQIYTATGRPKTLMNTEGSYDYIVDPGSNL